MTRLAYAALILFIIVIFLKFIGLAWLIGNSGKPLWDYMVDIAQILGFGFGIYAIWLTYSDRILRESPHLVLNRWSGDATLKGDFYTTSNDSKFIENIGLGPALDVILEQQEVTLVFWIGRTQPTFLRSIMLYADLFPHIGVDKEDDITSLLKTMAANISDIAYQEFVDDQPQELGYGLLTKLTYKDRSRGCFGNPPT